MFEKIYPHTGLPKTVTSFLQNVLDNTKLPALNSCR